MYYACIVVIVRGQNERIHHIPMLISTCFTFHLFAFLWYGNTVTRLKLIILKKDQISWEFFLLLACQYCSFLREIPHSVYIFYSFNIVAELYVKARSVSKKYKIQIRNIRNCSLENSIVIVLMYASKKYNSFSMNIDMIHVN